MALLEKYEKKTVSEEKTYKVISIVGFDAYDIFFYLCSFLQRLEKKTLIIDNSKTGALFDLFKKDDDTGIIEERCFTLARNAVVERCDVKDEDFTLIFHGNRVDKYMLGISDEIYICVDYDRYSIDVIKEAVRCINKANFILVGKMWEKQSPNWMSEYLNTEMYEDVTEIEFDESDAIQKLMLPFNRKYAFQKLSKPLQKEIVLLIGKITGMNIKTIRKMM